PVSTATRGAGSSSLSSISLILASAPSDPIPLRATLQRALPYYRRSVKGPLHNLLPPSAGGADPGREWRQGGGACRGAGADRTVPHSSPARPGGRGTSRPPDHRSVARGPGRGR